MSIALNLGSDAALADYSDLVDKTKLWLDRGSELDVLIPTFIALAEAYLNRTLRTPEMEALAAPPVANGGFRLPADCVQVRGLTSAGRPLTQLSPAQIAASYGALAGIPRAYAIKGRDVSIAPTANEPCELSYWQRIPALTINTPSNWLLDAHADVYLYGTLASAVGYIDEPESLAQWTGAFEGAVQQVVEASGKARWGGPIVMRSGIASLRGVRA